MDNLKVKRLGKFRQRIVISVLGFIYVGGKVYWTGELLSYVTILEEKIRRRGYEINDFDYRVYWNDWEYKWELIKIL